MSIQDDVRKLLGGTPGDAGRREEFDRLARELRLAWAAGIDTLYKFRSLNGDTRQYTLDIIENFRVYFASPMEFNDPFDCAPPFALAKSPNDPEFVKELEQDQRRMIEEAGFSSEQADALRAREGVPVEKLADAVRINTLKRLEDDVRVLCLSAEIAHPLLWSHYANGHTGICLHFRCARGTIFGSARKVLCQPQRQPILIPIHYQTDDSLTERMALVKADFWEYESEYRILGHTTADWGYKFDAKHRVSFPSELLCGITLGMRISDTDRDAVIKLAAARTPPIPLYQAAQNPERFWMDITPI